MRRVKLATEIKTSFWRFHTEGITDEGVCTIECLHILMRELIDAKKLSPHLDQHSFDNLLWYYAYLHQRVERAAIEKANRSGEKKLVVLGGVSKKKKTEDTCVDVLKSSNK